MLRRHRRLILAVIATLAVLGPIGWLWYASLVPGSYSVMDMGYVDTGGGASTEGHHHEGVSVATLVADPARAADVRVTLTARKERFRLASGQEVDGYTVNGTSPGPVIRAVEGQLVEATLVNDNVPGGVTLHWHGVDVPNAEDGVAGVTQDAVRPGKQHVYRFVADHAGTYWYHSHQVSHTQVQKGLLGALVIAPSKPAQEVETLALLHVYRGTSTVNGRTGDVPITAAAGARVRVRVINTDNGVTSVWSSAPYTVAAVDGRDLHRPTPVTGKALQVTAGGRADLLVTAPARVELGGAAALVIGGGSPVPQPKSALDLLSYGTPEPLPFEADSPDRTFRYSIGRRPGFVDGKPGFWWSINGHLFPDVPMFEVAEGDIVRMHLENHSGSAHPMHLHGHHAVVLSRDGHRATGSPWWVDSLDVASGHSYDIAFLADNPGIWMDHCHNLPHATQGLVAHLMYVGVSEPYRVGGSSRNQPE